MEYFFKNPTIDDLILDDFYSFDKNDIYHFLLFHYNQEYDQLNGNIYYNIYNLYD